MGPETCGWCHCNGAGGGVLLKSKSSGIPRDTWSSRRKPILSSTKDNLGQRILPFISSRVEQQVQSRVFSPAQRDSFTCGPLASRGGPFSCYAASATAEDKGGSFKCCAAGASGDMLASGKPSGQALIAVLVACVGAFSFGYHISVVNASLGVILADIGSPNSAVIGGSIVSISLAFAAAGSLMAGELADKLGRRAALQLMAVPLAGGSAMSALSSSPPLMLAGRAIVGFAFGVISCVVPIYISEVSPPSVRGRFGSLNQLSICIGILAALLAGLPLAHNPQWWRMMFWLGVFPAALLATAFAAVPESPRWLQQVGRTAEASMALQHLQGTSDSEASEATVQEEGDVAMTATTSSEGQSGLTLALSPRYRGVVLTGLLLFALQQFAGINAIIYFSSAVFRQVGIQSDVAASALVGLANVLGTAGALQLVDSQGRRSLLMASFAGMGLSMLLLALTFALPLLQPLAPALSLIGTIVYVLSFAMGAGPVPALLLPEMFPSSIRGTAVSLALGTHWVCNFVIGFAFLPVSKALGIAGVYSAFAAVCFLAVWFVKERVVETKGRSMAEIEQLIEAKRV